METFDSEISLGCRVKFKGGIVGLLVNLVLVKRENLIYLRNSVHYNTVRTRAGNVTSAVKLKACSARVEQVAFSVEVSIVELEHRRCFLKSYHAGFRIYIIIARMAERRGRRPTNDSSRRGNHRRVVKYAREGILRLVCRHCAYHRV